VANYFGPTLSASAELALAWAYDQESDPEAKAAIAAQLVTSLSVNAPFGLPYVKDGISEWVDFFAGHDLDLIFYEGGYSPDHITANRTATITGVTQAAQAVVTLAGGATVPVAGMSMSFASVGGMTQLNGNTYTVVSVVGQAVTINVNSTGFSAYTSGGTATYVNSQTMVNAIKDASKNTPELADAISDLYSFLLWRSGTFPSCYMLSGAAVWGVLDPDIYVTPDPPQWTAIKAFRSAARPKKLTLRF
jgi:hypothetical protein